MNEEKSAEHDVVVWVRLPRPMTIQELKNLGLAGAACYGGDTCIAATSMKPEVGIVLQPDIEAIMKKAKLLPQARCFGGDTCIV